MKTIRHLAALCLLIIASVSACLSGVDSTEDVGEAQGALVACGLRGACPTGYACDTIDMICRPTCSGSGTCDDQDGLSCTYGLCGHGTCNPTPINCDDGNECTSDACSGGACIHQNKTSSNLCGPGRIGHCNEADASCCYGAFMPPNNTCIAMCPPGWCKDAVTAQCFFAPALCP